MTRTFLLFGSLAVIAPTIRAQTGPLTTAERSKFAATSRHAETGVHRGLQRLSPKFG
jgi:hypothetical protein